MRSLVWRRFRRHRLAVASLVLLFLIVLLALLADVIAPRGPYAIDYDHILTRPDARFILGTDTSGRDVWARVVVGARVSLAVGAVAVVITQIIGILLGSLAGFYGSAVDNIIMRLTDVMLCFPTLILMLVVAAAFGAGIDRTMLVIGVISWPSLCRLVRGEILSLRERDFVLAARSMGATDRGLIMRHILPNVVPYLIVNATFGVAGAILSEASLSFLGLGVSVPIPSWGNMITAAQTISVLTRAPWYWLPPGLAISLTVLAINFIGDGLRDALDPRALAK
ncbi:MAG: ABC transporter permease [Chloroflexi bacterium]|nr:ABC transporter permease [Chloroflexota bacterium]